MDAIAVGSSPSNLLAQSAQRLPEVTEVPRTGGASEGHSEGGSAKVESATPAPSVNATGQKIGQIINVEA